MINYVGQTCMLKSQHFHSLYSSLTRVFWALAVLCALGIFAMLAVARIVYFYSYPKTVNVEVTFETKLPFPAVTVCNQNMFRYV